MTPNVGDMFEIVLVTDEALMKQFILQYEVRDKDEHRGFIIAYAEDIRQEDFRRCSMCGSSITVKKLTEDQEISPVFAIEDTHAYKVGREKGYAVGFEEAKQQYDVEKLRIMAAGLPEDDREDLF